MPKIKIITDPDAYGSKGQKWNPDFVEYMIMIVSHPTYSGMPDAIKEDGKIQWEAPSNRSSGKYQYTHHKRRDWWRDKAKSIGIDTSSPTWISNTAKIIHPTGEKVCKRCGRILRIAYVYPNGLLQNRIKSIWADFIYDPLDSITILVQLLFDKYGTAVFQQLPRLLSTGDIEVTHLGDNLDEWLIWLEDNYIPREPSLLSPVK